jgi:hypothetical protein
MGMTESSGLLPIVLGISLTAFSAVSVTAGRDRERSHGHAPLFNFAVLLVGFAVVGAALFELGSSIESGHRLSSFDARVENRLIIALGLLFALVAGQATWNAFVRSYDALPWERGLLDIVSQVLGFAAATVVVLLVGVAVDGGVISTAHANSGAAIFVFGAILLAGVGLSWFVLRLMTGGKHPSPRGFMRSRQQQLRVLDALEKAPGSWKSVRIYAFETLDPPLELSVSVWVTPRGWYLRSEDANAVVRYHRWAAGHAVLPTPTLHRQRLTVFVGPWPSSMRGLRITRPTHRWLWRLDAVRSHRLIAASAADASAQERVAGLVHISHEHLQQAGLKIIVS